MSRTIDVHRHAGVTAVPVPMGVVGALHRGVVVGRVLGAGLGHRVADVAGDRLAGAVIAALLHPSAQVLDRGLRGVEGHRRGLRNRVGVDGEHARPVAQRVLDDRLLGGVVQAADVQDRGLLGWSGRGAHGVHVCPLPTLRPRRPGPRSQCASVAAGAALVVAVLESSEPCITPRPQEAT